MLESMTKNPRPTRAEVSDVMNAVIDGADCVMLSGETAKGRYPVETVKMMMDVIKSAEVTPTTNGFLPRAHTGVTDEYTAVAKAAVTAAESSGAKCIVVLTKTGRTARLISSFRPNMPIVSYCPSYKIGRQLQIHKGLHPIVGLDDIRYEERSLEAVKRCQEMGFLGAGEGEGVFVLVSAEKGVEGGRPVQVMKVGNANLV